MQITKPAYFDRFRCIAGSCPDSCCKEWEVQVDDQAAAYYRGLPGDLGDRLRQVLREEEGCTLMTITEGRCPMWRPDGLCRIQAELGEQALCKTCREFPRLTHDYGDFIELGLELSCPEAARLIFASRPEAPIIQQVPGGEEPEYDALAMDILKATRRQALALLQDPSRPIGDTLALLLLYGYHAQESLDCGEDAPFDPDAALESARDFARSSEFAPIPGFFLTLELLTPKWEQLLRRAETPVLTETLLPMLHYLVQRYWLQAVSDYDLACRVKFFVIACLLVSSLPGKLEENAQLFSKEIENNIDNVDAILDASYSSPLFTDDKLLGLLLTQA